MNEKTRNNLIKILSKAREEIRELYFEKEIDIETHIKYNGGLSKLIRELNE